MKSSSYKKRRFLIPILLLVITSIILIASINTYSTINMFKSHMQNHIKNMKKEYLEKNKNEIYKNVQLVDNSIKYQITKIETKLKKSLKEKIETALSIAQYEYNKNKGKLSNKEIKREIAKHLNTIRFNEGRGYYFMYDNKTKILFGHIMKKFINRDMTNFKDLRGQNLMKLDAEALRNNKIGYNKIYFNKPNQQNKEFPKITCITKFEPLDIVIGTGEYLDIIENQIKLMVLDRFSNLEILQNRYLFFLDLHNINGGDDFATMLLNSNRTELVGKKISANKDEKGKNYTKEYLKNLKEKGESYTKYWYKKPNSEAVKLKMSYFYLQKDWNWIIGSGFYFDDLEKEIAKMEEILILYTNNTIYKTLILVGFLSFISIVIAVLVSIRIDKTIKNYTNKIVEHEEKQRVQDNLLIQQSKMASMGEMMESIAHQWRQPLSVITSSSSGIKIQKEFDILTDEKLFLSCDSITNSAQHLSDTIDDFRNFFNKDKVKNYFNIRDILHKTVALLSSKFKNKEIEIIENIDDINMNGFRNELVQVFMNILNNARDELEIQDIKRMIFIDIYKKDDNVIIKIKDNAGGIQNDILPEIFDSHFTTKQERDGTGIGLHMSKMIIQDSFKGTIKASNISFEYDGKNYIGAEFTILLPI